MSVKKPKSTTLHTAVKQGDVQAVVKLLKKGDSILAMDSTKNTPLHVAYVLKHQEITDHILAHIKLTRGYDKNPKNQHGLSHLHIACARGNAEAVANFELAGANVKDKIGKDSPVHAGYSCLQLACESKSLETVYVIVKATKLLYSCLEEKKSDFHFMGVQGFDRTVIKIHHDYDFDNEKKLLMSDLQRACFNGDVKKVEALLEEGKDVEETMSRTAKACPLYKPLHFAVEADKNRQKTVEMLLAYSAEVGSKNGFCMTALHLAMYNDNRKESKTAVRKTFLEDGTLDILYKATKDKEANPMDAFGLTYFHVAVACNDVKLVTKLMDKGEGDCKPILPNLKNFSMYTPLHFAVKYGHEDMAKLLIERGADVNASKSEDRFITPLQVAINYGQERMVDLLLASGANAKVVASNDKRTTLHLLVERFGDYEDEKTGLVGCMEKLLEQGVNIDAKDNDGDTALHNACRKLKMEIVDELLKCGADVNLRNKQGETAFDTICVSKSKLDYNSYFKIYLHVQKLKDFGLEVDEKNEKVCETIIKKKEEWKKSEDWPAIGKMTSVEELTRKHQEKLGEIERMKSDMLDEKVSLYDYANMDAAQAAKYTENERIKKVMTDENLYENYGYMISVMYKKALRWLKAQEPKKATSAAKKTSKKKKNNHTSPPATDPKVIKLSTQSLPVNSTLDSATQLGNIQRTQELLQKGASTKTVDADGNSSLHVAFNLKNTELVDLVLAQMNDEECTVDLKNKIGLTHLHVAASRGNARLVQKLIDSGANPWDFVNEDSPNFAGYNAIQFACDAKSLDTLRILSTSMNLFFNLLENFAGKLSELYQSFAEIARSTIRLTHDEKQSCNPISEFHLACLNGSVGDVERHLKRGAKINATMNRETRFTPAYTALHFAVESETQPRQKVEVLLKRGADASLKNGFGMTPLHLAMYYEDWSTIEMLYDHVKDKEVNPMDVCGLTYFHIVVARNDLPFVKKMLFKGENVNGKVLPNCRNFSMFTPLHFAIKYGHEEMTQVLIERGANVNANGDDLKFPTPLQLAMEFGKPGVIDILMEHNVNGKVARSYDKATIIHILTERFGKIEDDTEEGLDERGGLAWRVEVLVKLGVDIDAKDSRGNTALHHACRNWNRCSELVEWLLVGGADVNVKDKKGMTPLGILCRLPTLEIKLEDVVEVYNHVQKLKDLGLEVDKKNEEFCEIVVKNREVQGEIKKKKKQERQKEIERLKKDKLTSDVSMYDYLRMTAEQAAAYAKNERIRDVIDDEPRVLYGNYGYLIPVIYRKSLKWLESQEKTEVKTGKKTHRGKRRRS